MANLDEDAIKAMVARANAWVCPSGAAEITRETAINEQHLALDVIDLVNHVIGIEQSLEDATGPFCSSCGNSIDPDVCWCGDYALHHSGYEGHHFVAMGCDCSRGDRDWKKLATARGERLWLALRQRDNLRGAIEYVRRKIDGYDEAFEFAQKVASGELDAQGVPHKVRATVLRDPVDEAREFARGRVIACSENRHDPLNQREAEAMQAVLDILDGRVRR